MSAPLPTGLITATRHLLHTRFGQELAHLVIMRSAKVSLAFARANFPTKPPVTSLAGSICVAPQVAPKAAKIEISDGALAMAQTLLVAQSVGLVDAVADPNADTDIPATLDLKIGSSISAMNKNQYDNELDIPVTVPAELFAKARALVKGEVAAPSRNNYDTGPQPVHQLMSFLKQSVIPKDQK